MTALLTQQQIDSLINGVTYNLEATFVTRKPKGFGEFDGELVCPHRNRSVCNNCATAYGNIYEVWGVHYWARNIEELVVTVRMMADARIQAGA